MPRQLVPPWLRRTLESAVVAAIVALASLAGAGIVAGGPHALPTGPAGAIVLGPPVFALAVLPIAYPVAMAATRGDAVLGAIGGFLVAADLVVLLGGGRLLLGRADAEVVTGLFVAGLALLPAAIGLLAAQLATPLGFGRRAGAIGAVAAALAAAMALLGASLAT
ncbi:MAG TPA: hypothetical protein VH723_03780 [Candidatus Limnocylindrales bacterium]|jgi:hypothetical protein